MVTCYIPYSGSVQDPCVDMSKKNMKLLEKWEKNVVEYFRLMMVTDI